MKTVQLLYSYLLVEKPFSLESQPSNPTKEKRFAFSLYLDTIYLIYQLANAIVGKNKKRPLATSRFVLRIENDDQFRALIEKYRATEYPFASIEAALGEKIKDSLLFREFEKKRDEGLPIENFWENVYNAIISPDPSYNKVVGSMPGYSLSGVERMKTMMDVTFKNFYSSRDNIDDALKTLEASMQKARDLYMRLLALPVELTALHREKLEQNRKKLLATVADMNPNMKLVDNRIVELIERDPEFSKYVETNHLSWKGEDPELLQNLLKTVLESEEYNKYLTEEPGIKKDYEFWQDILVNVILNNEEFLEYLENKSVFWNDDLEIMTSFVIKTLKRLENPYTRETAVLPMYKDGIDGKDAHFGAELFNYVVRNKDIYRKYIQDVLKEDKWDAERLAFMDLVITMTALAEIINYPEIPVNVSINEYIEIAKSYSSNKSGQFVHGLLASLIEKLKEENIINK